jgi:hypothetical protein
MSIFQLICNDSTWDRKLMATIVLDESIKYRRYGWDLSPEEICECPNYRVEKSIIANYIDLPRDLKNMILDYHQGHVELLSTIGKKYLFHNIYTPMTDRKITRHDIKHLMDFLCDELHTPRLEWSRCDIIKIRKKLIVGIKPESDNKHWIPRCNSIYGMILLIQIKHSKVV